MQEIITVNVIVCMCDVTAPRDHFIMRFMGLFLTHAQTVDTRTFFSPCACNKGAGSRLGYTLLLFY